MKRLFLICVCVMIGIPSFCKVLDHSASTEWMRRGEEKLNANLGKWQLTTYQYVAPGHESIKITNFSTGRK